MNLTAEQKAILNTTGNLRINAVAGSGKTTTLIEYAKSRPQASRILYLAFNRSVKLEAQRKFAEAGLPSVKVETAHSLAYRYTVHKHGYKVKGDGYKLYDLAEVLGLANPADLAAAYAVTNHVARFAAYFCNSAADKVQQLKYGADIKEEKAAQLVQNFYSVIESNTRRFLKMMNDGAIEITPDFYLKKFQLSKPVLPYDVILFDEAQDASPAMTDVFLRQPATLVMVGDPHQQIYSWRYAVNALDSADFPVFPLTASFRFPPPVARLAVAALDLKKVVGEHQTVIINGHGNLRPVADKNKQVKAVIARTNLGLLLKAIEHITGPSKEWPVYFEGNLNSYTYADEGASIWDVLSLYNGRHESVRDKLIKSFKTFIELEDYIEKTEDASLGMLVKIVKEYTNRLPGLIASLKEKHVANEDKGEAKIIFSTVHRCKGMEYGEVELANDFITEEKIVKAKAKQKKEEEKAENKKPDWNPARLNEEINLLYVAITRAKAKLVIPEEIMIENFPPFDCIEVLKPAEPEKVFNPYLDYAEKRHLLKEKKPKKTAEEKIYDVEKIRESHGSAYQPWTQDADNELKRLFKEGVKRDELCEIFGRAQGGILSRLKKLGLV